MEIEENKKKKKSEKYVYPPNSNHDNKKKISKIMITIEKKRIYNKSSFVIFLKSK